MHSWHNNKLEMTLSIWSKPSRLYETLVSYGREAAKYRLYTDVPFHASRLMPQRRNEAYVVYVDAIRVYPARILVDDDRFLSQVELGLIQGKYTLSVALFWR